MIGCPVNSFTTVRPFHHCRVIAAPWPGIYFTHVDSARHFGKHWHAAYGLGLLEAGAHRSASGRGQVDAYAGDLLATNPGEVHDGRPLGAASRCWRMVYWDAAALAELAGSAFGTGSAQIARPVLQDSSLRSALEQLFERLEGVHGAAAGSDALRLACDESMATVCAMLVARHASGSPARTDRADTDLSRIRDRLADAPLDAPSLAQLAALAGLSRYQLLRRFARAYGMPPHAWLLQRRAERARDLIQGGTGLAEASGVAGFADQSHMTRQFARQFGFTPGAWQRAVRPRR
jgi:AraC-like DNA-binding protein